MDQTGNQTPNRNFFGAFGSTALFVWDIVKIVLIALVIVSSIRYFVFKPFIVSGSSMEPNYQTNQYLIIEELSYRFKPPSRGDVIVMRYPKDTKQFFIKRIIGLPGEKVAIDNGKVTIFNGQHPEGITLNESYLPNQGLSYPHDTALIGGSKIITLSSDQYFMMGDNRLASSDSRDWGPLPRQDIVGKVFVRVLPLNQFTVEHTPAYSF